ncbi:GntR family transcriptional regulator [Paenibacillus glycanilyticus]|uniref:HTH gntR-type domain-containing protein n=1 Tax=Paenibacillus glycanilyticus TaxID=126569 RepID=A0ABQ6GG65_9BACL|nr:GntR family transcriptional regulator [Paenibacillus glycanilyticus]GLX69939.1 hypothetical protein MU1_42850 [Paenibacillus glycanilyticus]
MSLIQKAYTYIREQILQGEFMPGTLLSEVEIAEQLGMSRTPVRSAMSQLESQGYVVTMQNRGIFIKEINLKEMIDIIEIQLAFQVMALKVIRETGEMPDLEAMRHHMEAQLLATAEKDYFQYMQHANLFQRCLIASSRNHVAIQMLDTLQDKSMRFAIINYKRTPHTPHFSANKLNQSIYDHLVAGEFEEIEALLNTVVELSKRRLLELRMM